MAGFKQHMASLKAKMGVSATKDEAWAYCTIKKLMDIISKDEPAPVMVLNEKTMSEMISEAVKVSIEPLLDGKWKATYRNAIDMNCEIKRLQQENILLERRNESLTKSVQFYQTTKSPAEYRLEKRIKELEDQLEAVMVKDGELIPCLKDLMINGCPGMYKDIGGDIKALARLQNKEGVWENAPDSADAPDLREPAKASEPVDK